MCFMSVVLLATLPLASAKPSCTLAAKAVKRSTNVSMHRQLSSHAAIRSLKARIKGTSTSDLPDSYQKHSKTKRKDTRLAKAGLQYEYGGQKDPKRT